MVEYKCERCHYVTKQKYHFKNHLQRKYPCRAIHSNISVEELLEKLNKPKDGFACNKCNKIFNSRQGKYQHQKRCKQELVVFEEKKNDNQKIQELENELKLMKENNKLKEQLVEKDNQLVNEKNKREELEQQVKEFLLENSLIEENIILLEKSLIEKKNKNHK